MADELKTTTVDQLPKSTNLNNLFMFGYDATRPVGSRSVQVSFGTIMPLFGVSQAIDESTTTAPSGKVVKEVVEKLAVKTNAKGESVVYGSIATEATEAQKDKLVNVGLMKQELAKAENLLIEYVHSGNKETYVESIDYETNTFYAPNHGLSNTTQIGVSVTNGENIYPYNVMPFSELPDYGFRVVNSTKDTFQLSLKREGEPIVLIEKPTIDLTKWKFESNTAHNVTFSNLLLPPDGSFVMDVIGQCVLGYSCYWGRRNATLDYIKEGFSTYGYDNIGPNDVKLPFFGGHVRIEELTSDVGGVKLITTSTLLYGKEANKLDFFRATSSFITRKINKSIIGIGNTLIANGTVVRIYKL